MKTEIIPVRFSKEEKAEILSRAASCNMKVSAYIRETILGHRPKQRLTQEERNAYLTLTQYASNFMRISNLLKNKDSAFSKEVIQTAKDIKKHLKKFS